ncbi:putative phytosulfokines 6 [Neltuma alba]|uniref:putative phytosulfokines 6 n=1 Tax=Neltuma alba TaxID=207710 RepID=UPI0010A2E1FB|nr:putative phytosulfokines 6 [Prosopis alba]XP_028808199.1 putative phytosulfokines 6 [Prosopis alba]
MKPSFHPAALLLFILFLVSSSYGLSARLSTTQKGLSMKSLKVSGENSVSALEGSEPIAKLMGMEDCNGGDEECLERRMTMEAHLDYIYTQHHKH